MKKQTDKELKDKEFNENLRKDCPYYDSCEDRIKKQFQKGMIKIEDVEKMIDNLEEYIDYLNDSCENRITIRKEIWIQFKNNFKSLK